MIGSTGALFFFVKIPEGFDLPDFEDQEGHGSVPGICI